MSILKANSIEQLSGAPPNFPNSLSIQGTPVGSAATEPTSRFPYVVGSVAELASVPEGLRVDGAAFQVSEFWPGTGVGGGLIYWDAARSKTEHNGGTVIDPDKTSELSGPGEFGTYFTPLLEGTGCWVRQNAKEITIEQFGAAQMADNTQPFAAAIFLGGYIYTEVKDGNFSLGSLSVNLNNSAALDIDLRGATITKADAWSTYWVTVTDVGLFTLRNVKLTAGQLAAVAWRVRSFRQEFTGFAKFYDCEAYDLEQRTSGGGGQAVGYYVEGGMREALFQGGTVKNVNSDGTVNAPITRGFMARSIFELAEQEGHDFPLSVKILDSTFEDIKQVADADGVFASAQVNAKGRKLSTFTVERCVFVDCDKRSIKSQYARTFVRSNWFIRTFNEGFVECDFQSGGGIAECNVHIYFERGANSFYGAKDDSDDYKYPTIIQNNSVHYTGTPQASSHFVLGAEVLRSSSFHAGLTVRGNYGGFVRRGVNIRPRSASSGYVTLPSLVVMDNQIKLEDCLIRMDRGQQVEGQESAFHSLVKDIRIVGNINTGLEVPEVIYGQQETNITLEFTDKQGNSGLTPFTDTTNVLGRSVNRGGLQEEVFTIGAGVSGDQEIDFVLSLISGRPIKITCIAQTGGSSSLLSYATFYCYKAGSLFSSYTEDFRSDDATGFWQVTETDKIVTITKTAGFSADGVHGWVRAEYGNVAQTVSS